MGTTSLSGNCAEKRFLSPKTIIGLLPSGIPKPCNEPPTNSMGRYCSNALTTGALIVGPKFSARERAAGAGLHRIYAGMQIEYCRNFIFKRHWPIRSIFQRSCELGLYLLTADRVAVLFGQQRLLKRISGKWQNVLERLDHGRQVFRTYYKNSFLKQYEKATTFLRRRSSATTSRTLASKKRSRIGRRCESVSRTIEP
jgi:hypothetical protein